MLEVAIACDIGFGYISAFDIGGFFLRLISAVGLPLSPIWELNQLVTGGASHHSYEHARVCKTGTDETCGGPLNYCISLFKYLRELKRVR